MKGLLLLYRRIQKLYDRHMDDIRKSFSLSRIEITIISFLHNNPGLDTAGDIAEYRMLSKGNVSQSVEALIQKGYLEKCYQFEKTKGFERVSKSISNMLRITSSDGLIVNYIKDHITEKSVVFITGIGKCYPILRSHTVLNNLHQVVDQVPVVLFYPGKYDGQELVLFGEIKDDNYYRAFKLVD